VIKNLKQEKRNDISTFFDVIKKLNRKCRRKQTKEELKAKQKIYQQTSPAFKAYRQSNKYKIMRAKVKKKWIANNIEHRKEYLRLYRLTHQYK